MTVVDRCAREIVRVNGKWEGTRNEQTNGMG